MPCPYIDECGYKPTSLTMKEINPEHHEGFCSDNAAYAGCCWFVNRLSTPTKIVKNEETEHLVPKLSKIHVLNAPDISQSSKPKVKTDGK